MTFLDRWVGGVLKLTKENAWSLVTVVVLVAGVCGFVPYGYAQKASPVTIDGFTGAGASELDLLKVAIYEQSRMLLVITLANVVLVGGIMARVFSKTK